MRSPRLHIYASQLWTEPLASAAMTSLYLSASLNVDGYLMV